MMSFEEFQKILCNMNVVMTHEEQLQAYDRYMEGILSVRESCH